MVRSIRASMTGRRQGLQPAQRAAGELHGRLPARTVDHAHVAPPDAGAHAGAERLGARFLGGETLGVGLDAIFSPLGARPLGFGVKMRWRNRSPCRSITLAMRRTSVMSEPMPRIMAERPALARPRSMAPRMVLIASSSPTNTASPTRKWPMLSSDDLRQSGDGFGAGVVEAVAGVNFEAKLLGQLGALADAPPFGVASRACRRRRAHGTRRRCEFRSPAHRARRPPRSARDRRR